MAAWRFVVCRLDGKELGEPRSLERSLNVGVSKVASARIRITSKDPLFDQAAAGETMLKVFDSGEALRLYGPMVGEDESGDGKSTSALFTASDLRWRLSRRYVAKNATGIPTTYSAVDAGTIAYNVLAAVNADEATGISEGNKDAFTARTVSYLWKNALQALHELGAFHTSYEHALRYVDGTPAPTVYLDLKTKLGSAKTSGSSAIFLEYGTGLRNCSTYRLVRSIEQLAGKVWVQGQGGTITVSASDAAAIAQYGLHEDVLSFGDISVTSLLDALALAHVGIRKQPRELLELTPFAKLAPRYGVDWVEGDVVRSRVVANGKTRVDGAVRIWGADITIDRLGDERPALQLVADG